MRAAAVERWDGEPITVDQIRVVGRLPHRAFWQVVRSTQNTFWLLLRHRADRAHIR